MHVGMESAHSASCQFIDPPVYFLEDKEILSMDKTNQCNLSGGINVHKEIDLPDKAP